MVRRLPISSKTCTSTPSSTPRQGGDEQQFSGKFRVSDEDSGYFHLLARLDPAPGEEAVTLLNLMQIDRDGRLQNLTAQAEAVRLVGH